MSRRVADLSAQTRQPLTGQFRLLAAVDGRVSPQQLTQTRNGVLHFNRQRQQVPDDSAVKLNPPGLNGAAVEGFESLVLEIATDGLRITELPRLELTDLE